MTVPKSLRYKHIDASPWANLLRFAVREAESANLNRLGHSYHLLSPDPETMHPFILASARRTFGLSAVALLLALSACGDDGAGGTSHEASSDGVAGQTVAPSPSASGASAAQLEVRISEGPFAGTHQAPGNVTCVAEPGTWVMSTNRPGDRGITQATLVLEGVQPTGGNSQQMSFVVHFGDPMDDTSATAGTVFLDPAGGEGTGTGRVRRDGQGAVVEVDGTTGDGVRVSAVIRCETVAGIQ
jgi:hypothetical protein